MAKIDFSAALFVALGNKRQADFQLHLVQQEIANGNRAFTVSSMLSLLENCDDAQDAVWLELRRALHQGLDLDAPDLIAQHKFAPTDKQPRYGMAFHNATASRAQKRVREFLTKTPPAFGPHQNIS